jgi:uncharacterized protein YkwD
MGQRGLASPQVNESAVVVLRWRYAPLTFVVKSLAHIALIASVVLSGLSVSMPRQQDGNPIPAHVTAVANSPAQTLDDVLFAASTRPDPAPSSDDPAPPPAGLDAVPVAAPTGTAPVVAALVRQPVAVPAAPPPAPAPPPIVIGSTQQVLINQDRAGAGLPPLSWSSCLAGIADGQAQAMARAGYIFHGNGVQRDWGCGLGSSQTGENVGIWGAGINDAGINQLFTSSPSHRANILGPYHHVGTTWVVSGGKGYIAVEFG